MCRVTLRCQGYFCHVWPLEKLCVHGRVIMNYVSAVAAARTTRTSSCWHGAVRHVCQEDKVRTLLRRTTLGSLPWAPLSLRNEGSPTSSPGCHRRVPTRLKELHVSGRDRHFTATRTGYYGHCRGIGQHLQRRRARRARPDQRGLHLAHLLVGADSTAKVDTALAAPEQRPLTTRRRTLRTLWLEPALHLGCNQRVLSELRAAISRFCGPRGRCAMRGRAHGRMAACDMMPIRCVGDVG